MEDYIKLVRIKTPKKGGGNIPPFLGVIYKESKRRIQSSIIHPKKGGGDF